MSRFRTAWGSPLLGSLLVFVAGVSALNSLACSKSDSVPTPASSASPLGSAAPSAPRSVTILVTANENGYLSRSPDASVGGAAELLGQWVAKEHHCAGQLGEGGGSACPNGTTLVLSAGDHWGGPALSAYFEGIPTAQAMARMGYAASAFGNHEFDLTREGFLKAQTAGGFPHLAANASVSAALEPGVSLPAVKVFERAGLKVGVIGLASKKTKSSVMAGRVDGIDIVDYEKGIQDGWSKLIAAPVDAVVVLAHECPEALAAAVERHPEWKIALVAGACRTPSLTTKQTTTFASAGEHFDGYLRAELSVDTSKPLAARVVTVRAEHIKVAAASIPDAELAKAIGGWQQKLDAALGEEVGVSATGLTQESAQMRTWITTSLREITKVDVAVANKKGIRQSLPKGKLTKSAVYSVVPYENSVLLLALKGSDLATVLARPEAIVSGFVASANGTFKDVAGKPLDPAKTYSVATLDYLYFGGDGFDLERLDPDPKETGMLWQTAIIDWTKSKKSTASKPIESLLK